MTSRSTLWAGSCPFKLTNAIVPPHVTFACAQEAARRRGRLAAPMALLSAMAVASTAGA
jgi:hypothetical protein